MFYIDCCPGKQYGGKSELSCEHDNLFPDAQKTMRTVEKTGSRSPIRSITND